MVRKTRAALTSLGLTLVIASAAQPVQAQTTFLTLGNGLYGADAHCPTPGAAITTYRAGLETSILGFSATFNNEDYPWPPPDEGFSSAKQEAMMDHGDAFQIAVEFFPLGILGDQTRRLGTYVRPFIGAGFHRSGDGSPAPANGGQEETIGVVGSTDVLLTYGAKLNLPVSGRIGVRLEVRGNSVFAGDFEQETSGGAIITTDGATLNWGEYSVGFTLRVR